jgi:uncharacterized protein YajQ (UPF0234 family)
LRGIFAGHGHVKEPIDFGELEEEMADSSFDIVSKVDRMELDNALNQADRELGTRFDFRGTETKIAMSGTEIVAIESGSEERAKAALDVFKEKCVKRGVSLKHLGASEPQPSGKLFKINVKIKEGISTENAKKLAKFLRDSGPKSLKTQIQGEELRVSSKSRDDLQEAIALVKAETWDFAPQFTNYR